MGASIRIKKQAAQLRARIIELLVRGQTPEEIAGRLQISSARVRQIRIEERKQAG